MHQNECCHGAPLSATGLHRHDTLTIHTTTVRNLTGLCQEVEDLGWSQWQTGDGHPEGRQRVGHRVDDRGRGADGAALADALVTARAGLGVSVCPYSMMGTSTAVGSR
jgi:hypothetical protein